MPTPPNERKALEQERAGLPAQIVALQQGLATTPVLPSYKARRERLEWEIRNLRKRLVAVGAKLAAMPNEE